MTRPYAVRPAAVRGFSLVEIMVALLISAFLIVGAITVFLQSRNTSRTADTASRLQETVRYALETIEPDVRMANYWGMTNRAEYVTNAGALGDALDDLVVGNCGVDAEDWTVNLARYVEGSDNGYDLDCPGESPTDYSDVLVIRRASGQQAALAANTLQIQSNRMRAEIFADGVRPGTFAAAPASQTHNLVVHAYYVGEAPDGPNGLPQWALRRKELTTVGGAPTIVDTEIIRGIQDMQIEFGIDRNGDNAADSYVDPESAAIGANAIVSVRVWLLAVSDEEEQGFVNDTEYQLANFDHGSFDDGRRRVVVQKTIQLRNSRIS